jgi:succinate dehydrogenase / fumarate reductase cytochrome b subunit
MSSPSRTPPYSRPLSPHLQVYRFQLTSVLSIMHRVTGLGLTIGTIAFVAWLGAIAMGPKTYLLISGWYSSPLGIAAMLGWAFCFYFHLANGVRHLFWDVGWGFALNDVYRSGWLVIGFAMVLTLLTFWWVI